MIIKNEIFFLFRFAVDVVSVSCDMESALEVLSRAATMVNTNTGMFIYTSYYSFLKTDV